MPPPYPTKRQKMSARSRLQAARRVESAPSPMKKDPDHNWRWVAICETVYSKPDKIIGCYRPFIGRAVTWIVRRVVRSQRVDGSW
jgi:hypothetical protein